MPGRHQVGDAVGDGPGLAGAGAGQHADRAGRSEHRRALTVVEAIEMREHATSTGMRTILSGSADKTGTRRRACSTHRLR